MWDGTIRKRNDIHQNVRLFLQAHPSIPEGNPCGDRHQRCSSSRHNQTYKGRNRRDALKQDLCILHRFSEKALPISLHQKALL